MSLGLRRGTVLVEPHNAEWDVIAAETIAELHRILQDVLVDAQHIGSTAIKDICAKVLNILKTENPKALKTLMFDMGDQGPIPWRGL